MDHTKSKQENSVECDSSGMIDNNKNNKIDIENKTKECSNAVHLNKEISDAVLNVINEIVLHQCDEKSDTSTSQFNETNGVVYSGATFHCDKCPRKIKRKDNFKRHYWQVHKMRYQDNAILNNTKNICIFPGCSEVFYHKSRMIEHLTTEHNVSVDVDHKIFGSFDDFMSWKVVEEGENFVCFTKRDERKISSNISYSSYVCQHDGVRHKRSGKKLFCRKSVKKDLICPARMLVRRTINTDSISVKYIKSHNHKITYDDIRKHPLPQTVKNDIKEKLLLNKSVDDIFSELHQEAHEEVSSKASTTAIKKVFVNKNKIQYIKKKLNLSKTTEDNKLLIEDRLKALSTENFNPILLYKPEELAAETENPAPGQDEDVTFIFGLQTKEQLETFQKYADKIVFLELMQPTSNIPYYILTLKVMDELFQGYNVAHLITNVKDNDIVYIFLNEIKLRCTKLAINTVMTTLDDFGVKAFTNVFGNDIHFIFSKWHLHEMLFTKLLTDYPLEEELRHQVYFTLVALVEELDQEQFKSIISDFVHLYEDRCPLFVTFLVDNYLNKPEKWAICYRESSLRCCDVVMHGNDLLPQLKSMIKLSKDICSIDELLHAILNINQADYLKHKCRQVLKDPANSNHDVGLRIPDTDVSKISDNQWLVLVNNKSYEVNWNLDGCFEMFCQVRCLELVCFGLCKHMYTCSCGEQALICSHVHKVHALETGVCRFQRVHDDKEEMSLRKPKFILHKPVMSKSKPVNSRLKALFNVQENIKVLQKLIEESSEEDLIDVNTALQSLNDKCKQNIHKRKKRKKCERVKSSKKRCEE